MRDRPPSSRHLLREAAVAALACALAGGAAHAGLPPENRCPALGGLPGGSDLDDAVPTPLREGMLLSYQDVLALRQLIPPEIWRHRNVFFHEGMRMELGPCHRRYPVPASFAKATQDFAGRAKVDRQGNLEGFVAGLPFPPDRIDPKAPDAGIRWAWNLEQRYRGSGPIGKFRLVDMPSRIGSVQTYEGSSFFVQTGQRADLAETGYAVPEADGSVWIAGGRFLEPFNARHLAWTQLRPLATQSDYTKSDDTFVYVPTMRKVRRAATAWIDGLYVPRYRVGGDSGGGGIAIGGGGPYSVGGAINPTAGESIAVTEHLRRGFTGLALRPNAYVWRVSGEREVLAPINAAYPGYPTERERNYGESGLSFASDRWDVRWAVVIEGVSRQRGRDFERVELYVDYQTQQPLYFFTRDSSGGLVDVGILVHRFSGDVFGYPTFPNGGKAFVFDPVAAFFYNASDQSGWRREAFEIQSVPPDPEDVRRYTSPNFLTRGH